MPSRESLELMMHLQLVPFLDLKIDFDAKPILREAQSLHDDFIAYRDRGPQPKSRGAERGPADAWRTLALRSVNGETTNSFSYLDQDVKGVYKDTEAASRAPHARRLLEKLIDWPRAERIRFMSLEPGGFVLPHRDSISTSVHLSLNISLNMPRGCSFWTDLSADDAESPHAKRVPFKNSGSAFLLNTSALHAVKNTSRTTRYHLIAIGRTRIPVHRLLELAREQNKIEGLKDVARALALKAKTR